jgi:nucleotide-binding universal stress UspA family protein
MNPDIIISPLPIGTLGFDSNVPITAAIAKLYVARGYRFCIRYVSRDDGLRQYNSLHGTADISSSEANNILNAGMALMIVQHVPKAGWAPNPSIGRTWGEKAAAYASEAGYKEGCNLWLDLEEVAAGTPAQTIIDYCNAWFNEVINAGYVPGLYVGVNPGLDSDALFYNLRCKHYWRAGSRDVPDVSHRGYQIFQQIHNAGLANEFDSDVIKADQLGGLPLAMLNANTGLHNLIA